MYKKLYLIIVVALCAVLTADAVRRNVRSKTPKTVKDIVALIAEEEAKRLNLKQDLAKVREVIESMYADDEDASCFFESRNEGLILNNIAAIEQKIAKLKEALNNASMHERIEILEKTVAELKKKLNFD